MVIKQYKDNDFEILITQNEDKSYNIIKLTENKQSDFQKANDIDTALEVFDYFLDRLQGNDLESWGM